MSQVSDSNSSQYQEKGNHEAETFSEELKVNPNATVVHSTAKSFGIRKVEILADQYDSFLLKFILYVSVFICAYVYSLDGTIRYTFQSYATSSYAQHSLLSTVTLVRAVVAAAAQPCYARLADRIGRLELILVSILFYVVGTIVESQAYDVQKFAAGACIYQIGYTGIMLLLQVTIADTSNLNWRMALSFIPATSFIINTWVSGDVQVGLYNSHGWSYGIGIFAFIFPLSCIPLVCCYIHMLLKARKTPEWELVHREEKESSKSKWISWKNNIIFDVLKEIDAIGLLFVICIFGFILVPFTLAGGAQATWKKASTIAPLVIGFVLIPFFVLWEAKGTNYPIVPYKLIKDRGVWAALCIAVMINFIWYMPNDYMYAVLMVGLNTSPKASTRITSLYSFVSVIAGPITGIAIALFRRTKGFIIAGVCVWFISSGLLYYTRGSNDGIRHEYFKNILIFSECLLGFGAALFTYTTQVSISANTNHEFTAVIISLYLAAYNIGSAFGASVSGAVWTQKMYGYIIEEMTKAGVDTSLALEAYSKPYEYIVKYTWGTKERIPVVLAYAKTQKILCLIGLVLCVPLLCFAFFLRDHKLESVQSLDQSHDHDEGVKAQEGKESTVVLNDYDEDAIIRFFQKKLKRN